MKLFYITLLLLISPYCYSQSPCPGIDSLNYGGQWYHTVQVGSQCWLKENLNIGTMIAAVRNQINIDTIEKYCYNNDPAMCNVYGGLYQWREAMQYTQKLGTKGICPTGWHIPSIPEFDILISSVNSNGNALKAIGQGGGTNSSGFSVLLGGFNSYTTFDYIGINADFMSCNAFYQLHSDPYETRYLGLWNDQYLSSTRYQNADYGFSVRCLKDTAELLLQSPYGGENWQIGSTHKISWGGNLIDKKINIELSTDNGITWLLILNSAPANDGEYNWTIPNTTSKNCIIKITDINNTTSFSISDSIFTIYDSCPGGSKIEHGGKLYNTIMIGNKCWFKENVNIGHMIPGNQEQPQDSILEKYCYNDDTLNCTNYGGLYTVSEMKEPGFCPTFWHTPTNNELAELSSKVIYDGNALKSIGSGNVFGTGTNTSGFSALLAGIRDIDGTFHYINNCLYFPVDYINYPVKIDMYYLDGSTSLTEFLSNGANPNIAGSSRCVMDDVGPLTLKAPAGGENFIIGTIQKIKWTLSEVANIQIDYTTNNGTTWKNITPSYPTSAGSYNWTIPSTPSTNCRVKITSTSSSDTNSISNLFSIYQIPTNRCPGIPTVEYEGKIYNTITIGDQCWMRENLNIGTMINGSSDQANNGIIEKYCYNNDTNNCSIYGGLYQWNEAMQYVTTEKTPGICPSGWHIPSWNDLSILKSSVSNNSNALKELGQGSGSGAGTNSSGFSALLAGRSHFGSFSYINVAGDWWTSTLYDLAYAYNLQVSSSTNTIQGIPVDISLSYSIRCINDSSVSALPVELTLFTVSANNNNVNIKWNTATEINAFTFEIQRKSENLTDWNRISSIPASGTSYSPKKYMYVDKSINPGVYYYRLKIIDFDGSFKYSHTISIKINLPIKFDLGNAYPNPFNPTTTIKYQIPLNTLVTIKVFDALGREITTLVNEEKQAGIYEVTLNGKNLSSGVYYYRMDAGDFIETKKIVIIK